MNSEDCEIREPSVIGMESGEERADESLNSNGTDIQERGVSLETSLQGKNKISKSVRKKTSENMKKSKIKPETNGVNNPQAKKKQAKAKSAAESQNFNDSLNASIERVILNASKGDLSLSFATSDSDFVNTPEKKARKRPAPQPNEGNSSKKKRRIGSVSSITKILHEEPMASSKKKTPIKSTPNSGHSSVHNFEDSLLGESIAIDNESESTKILFPTKKKDKKSILSDIPMPKLDKEKPKVDKEKRKSGETRFKSPRKTGRQRSKVDVDEKNIKHKVDEKNSALKAIVDISNTSSIEALTELVREKRIRPPYGRPYSVVGTWYIASGYLRDLSALLMQFEKKESARFVAFAECWRAMLFTQIYRGRQSFKELLEYSEEVVTLTKKFLEPIHSSRKKIGALYTLYSLYYKHPVRQHFSLRFTPQQFNALCEFVKALPHLSNPDPARVLIKLLADSAFQNVATDHEMCIGFHTSYGFNNVDIEYGYLKLSQSNTVARALPQLSIDEKLMQEYHQTKVALSEGDSENVPEKALDFFKSSTAQEVQTELKGLEQYTSDQLNFEESKISNKKSTEVNDPNLTLATKRYEIRKRAESIAAVEAQQLLSMDGDMPDEMAKKTLSLAAEIANKFVQSKYVGKLECKQESSEPFKHPLSLGEKNGVTVIKRKRGRPHKYHSIRNKNRPVLPLSAMTLSLAKKNKREQLLEKMKEKEKVSFSLSKKKIMLSHPTESPQIVLNLEKSNTVVIEDEGLESVITDHCSVEDGISSIDNDHSMLDFRLQMLVNGKPTQRSIKANITAEQFEEIRSKPLQLKKLKEKLHLMLLPKYKQEYGNDCEVKDLKIVKAMRCNKPDSVRPVDFITGNQPFVKSGVVNLKRRLKMIERYRQKTPIKPIVEEVTEDHAHASIKLVPIVVGDTVRYIQSCYDSVDTGKELPLPGPVADELIQSSSVLRSHNCNWMESKKITEQFKNFKHQLNAQKRSGVAAAPVIKQEYDKDKFSFHRDGSSNILTYTPLATTKNISERQCSPLTTADRVTRKRQKELEKENVIKNLPTKQKRRLSSSSSANASNQKIKIDETPALLNTSKKDLKNKSPSKGVRKAIKKEKTTPKKVEESPQQLRFRKSGRKRRILETQNGKRKTTDESAPKEINLKEVQTTVGDFLLPLSNDNQLADEVKKEPIDSFMVQIRKDWEDGEFDLKPLELARKVTPSRPSVDNSSQKESVSSPLYESETEGLENHIGESGLFEEEDVAHEAEDVKFYPPLEIPAVTGAIEIPAVTGANEDMGQSPNLDQPYSGPATSGIADDEEEFIFMNPSEPGHYVKVPKSMISNSSSHGSSSFIIGNNVSTAFEFNSLDSTPQLATQSSSMQPFVDNQGPSNGPVFNSIAGSSNEYVAPYPNVPPTYIKAVTADGQATILPADTFFSIVQPDGSETNTTKLNFEDSSNPIMLKSMPAPEPLYSPLEQLPSQGVTFSKDDLMATLNLKPSTEKIKPLASPSPPTKPLASPSPPTKPLASPSPPTKPLASPSPPLDEGPKRRSLRLSNKKKVNPVPAGAVEKTKRSLNYSLDNDSSPIKAPVAHSTFSEVAPATPSPISFKSDSNDGGGPSKCSTPAASRPVCNFLFSKKFRPLQSVFGGGTANGTAPPSARRVSFFRKGSLKF